MIVGMQVFFTILVFSGSVPRYGIAGSLGTSVFSFLKNLHNVLRSECTHLHSHPWWEGFFLSTVSAEFIVVDFLRCSFWLMWYLTGQLTSLPLRTSDFRIFSSTLWPSLCLLWSKVHLDLWPIFYGIAFCYWVLQVVFMCGDKFPVALFAWIFSILVCLFFPLMVSFVLQMLLMSIRSHLFVFMSWFLEVGQKRSRCILCQSVLCFFSSRVPLYLFFYLDI